MSGVQSIERAFSILRVLSRGTLGVTDIADRTSLPKSTVSRLLAALEAEGAVEQAEAGGEYSIGSALATLAGSASPSIGLRGVVRPFIEELAMLTGGSSGFTVREGAAAYWVDNVDDADELVTLADQTGLSFPLHSMPSGLAMLSKLEPDELVSYVGELDEDLDDPLDEAGLRHRLGRVMVGGIVVSKEEVDDGVNAFAAAFRLPDGRWDGAVYLQGPSFRFPDEGDERRVIKLIREAAMQISDRLVGS
ncbi:MAG: IclR family transcriptional regulator [Ilumatobacter sp.]